MAYLGSKRLNEIRDKVDSSKNVRELEADGYRFIKALMMEIRLELIQMNRYTEEELEKNDYLRGLFKGRWEIFRKIVAVVDVCSDRVMEEHNRQAERLIRKAQREIDRKR